MSTATARKPPTHAGHWLWGSLMQHRKDPLAFLLRCFHQYGDLVAHRMGPVPVFQVNHPDLVKYVLVDKPQVYEKSGYFFDGLKPLLSNGLVISVGETWKRQRRLQQPAFHREKLAMLVQTMVKSTSEMIQRWQALPPNSTVDLVEEMVRLTLSTVNRTLFSTDLSSEVDDIGRATGTCLRISNARCLSLNPLRASMPTRENRDFDAALGVLNRAIARIIDERRKDSAPRDDLLSMLMAARYEDTNEGMDDRQLRDELLNLLLAGHETTAMGLTFMWSLLHFNPEAARKLREEVVEVLGDRDPTAQDLPKLKRVLWTFEETLRLYPPSWGIGRTAKEADAIAGYKVTKGTFVLASPWVIHRHPAFWEDPERFDPERFSPERSQNRAKLSYIPFGAGQRQCIGSNFSMMEAQIVTAMVARRFQPELVVGQMPEPDPLITLRPKREVRVRLLPVVGTQVAAQV